MAEAEKALSWFEKFNVNVSIGTLVATIVVLFVLAYVFFTKYYPKINQGLGARAQRQIEKEKEKQHIQEMEQTQKEQGKQIDQMFSMLKDLSSNVGKLSNQLDRDYNGHRVTLSVLLDIVECMQATTSPEECARQAQSKINGYLGNGTLPLQ